MSNESDCEYSEISHNLVSLSFCVTVMITFIGMRKEMSVRGCFSISQGDILEEKQSQKSLDHLFPQAFGCTKSITHEKSQMRSI